MRFLADQDVYAYTIAFLRSQGHDVLTAREAGLSTTPDQEILGRALETGRILLTRDSDFGSLAFLNMQPSTGIILLRIARQTASQVHQELLRLITEHTEEELHYSFVVVEPSRHRIRNLP